MYAPLTALLEPESIASFTRVAFMFLTALVFGYLALVVVISPF